MFDFSDFQMNPFMFMMNMDEDDAKDMKSPGFEDFYNPMMFMQQMFMMNMMIMQNMFMMPMQMMQFMMNMGNMNSDTQENGSEEKAGAAAPAGGFKLGNMNIPPEMLTKLMEMDMSPENLQKLQKVLDFVFSAMPDQKAE